MTVLINDFFVSPEVQIANIRRWNEGRGWGFGEADFANLPHPPAWPGGVLAMVALVPYLSDGNGVGGTQRTFDELWEVAASRWPKHRRDEDLLSDPEHLRYFGARSHEPGLRWETIDLGANWDKENGIMVMSVRARRTSFPGAGILAAAAHHPEWVRAMHMERVIVPRPCLAGYEITTLDGPPWRRVPILYFHRYDNMIGLSYHCDDDAGINRNYAIPEFVV